MVNLLVTCSLTLAFDTVEMKQNKAPGWQAGCTQREFIVPVAYGRTSATRMVSRRTVNPGIVLVQVDYLKQFLSFIVKSGILIFNTVTVFLDCKL